MSETFNSFLKNIYIPAREKTKSFFLKIRTPIRITKNIIFSAFIVYIIFNYSKIIETFIPNVFKFITAHTWESAIALFILLTTKKYLASYAQNFFSTLTNKYFMLSLAVLAIAGASAALFIPSYTNWFRENDSPKSQQTISNPQPTQSGQDTGNQQKQESKNSASELRGHLLYITGGVIAVLGLIETNRKNSQDHTREVHTARRDRYIEAVDKLSSDNAPVRLGGVYALVGLVDEWLDDNNIDKETRIKEGQIIINNLCSYIRSPFPLAERIDEYKAKEEKEFNNKFNGREFPYFKPMLDFFTAPTRHKRHEDITTEYKKFHEEQDVRRTIFDEMSKRSSTISRDNKGKAIKIVPGTWSEFDLDFSRAPIFYPLNHLTIEKGNFLNAKLYADSNFTSTVFISNAVFWGATFTHNANFSWAVFTHDADFSWATFTHTADFRWAEFAHDVGFRWATFAKTPSFLSATFTKDADFGGVTFIKKADFSEATFAKSVNFSEAFFEKYEPTFARKNRRAQFSVHLAQEDYDFSVSSDSKPIHTKETKLNGVTRRIPIGAVLFDPSSPKDENGKYRESPPA